MRQHRPTTTAATPAAHAITDADFAAFIGAAIENQLARLKIAARSWW